MYKLHHIHRVYHHVRHTRPRWYHEYHRWKHHAIIHWFTFTFSSLVILIGFVNATLLIRQYQLKTVLAVGGTTSLSATVNAGSLSLTPPGSATLNPVTLNVAGAQNTSGNLGTVTATDNRGSGVGWTMYATSTSFVKYNTPVRTGGAAGSLNVDSTSTFFGTSQGTITVNITGGGALGVATFSISGLDTASGTTGASVTIGGAGPAKGLILQFGAGTYTTSDAWTIKTDVIPVTGFTITPGSVTAVTGTTTGFVDNSAAHTYTTTSDQKLFMSQNAGTGYGMGSYTVAPTLQLTIPANTYQNGYTATMTETMN